MAKRKAGRGAGRKTGGKRAAGGRLQRSRKAARKQATKRAKSASARKTRNTRRASTSARRAPARKTAQKRAKRTAVKASARKTTTAARKRSTQKAVARPPRRETNSRASAAPKIPVPLRKVAARKGDTAVARKAPALNRVRRTVTDDDDIVQTPPSSLDLDRSASAVRTGRREMKQRFDQHTETSPALTAGDVDADWESAYSVGDEAPGGDNPTPDQDIVDDIGKAVGLQYEDNEELKGEKKISDRDAHRWELDPASAEDYNEHDQD